MYIKQCANQQELCIGCDRAMKHCLGGTQKGNAILKYVMVEGINLI